MSVRQEIFLPQALAESISDAKEFSVLGPDQSLANKGGKCIKAPCASPSPKCAPRRMPEITEDTN